MHYILIAIIILVLLSFSFNCGHPPFPGAMCYAVVAVPQYAQYVCPKCGEKTIYPSELNKDSAIDSAENQRTIFLVHYDMDECRRMVREIHGISIELDESQFCRHCSPDIQTPQLIAVIRFPGEPKEYRYAGITRAHLYQLKEFLNKENNCIDSTANEFKSEDCLEQIDAILGPRQP